jgi:hypothetical protein
MLVAAAIEVETIIWSGPILTISGLVNAIIARSSASWTKLFLGLSGPLVCALIAVCIAVFNWNPNDAEKPTIVIMTLYLFVFLPVSVVALRQEFNVHADADGAVPRLQFSMKSLLIAVTAICLVIAVVRFLLGSLRADDLIFQTYAFVVVTLSAAVIWRFAAYRRRVLNLSSTSKPFGTGTTTSQDGDHEY